MVPLPIKGAKLLPWAENLNKLFTVLCGKFKFSAQGSDLAPFVGNGTKFKIPSEIKPPLVWPEKLETLSCLPSLHRGHFQFRSSEFECATKIWSWRNWSLFPTKQHLSHANPSECSLVWLHSQIIGRKKVFKIRFFNFSIFY